ncbi:hypothetical protein PG985_013048 [Apiospora marii]|uniref:uncharacterized protein n=1 Tax=Apiospora marii TaxID=335849 RepID=UPI003131F6DF
MYPSLQLPWSAEPSPEETAYREAGLVRTQGTVFLLPPDRQALVESFNAPPRPKTRMSAGAVALCKHFERGGASSEHGRPHPFWPLPKGSNEHKTALAAGVLETVLGNVRWENVLMLHSYVAIYEVRNSRGFGLRWTLNLEAGSSGDMTSAATSPSDLPPAATPTPAATSTVNNDHTPAMTDDKVPSGVATAEKGPGDGEVNGEGEGEGKEKEAAAPALRISRVVFRGFVEPILNLDHELPDV